MNTTDIVILVILGLALFKGLKDGIIKQIGGIAGLLLGIYLASKFSTLLAGWLGEWIHASEPVVKAISFTLIIIGVIICMYFIGKLLETVFDLTTLGWVNKVLGMLFSIFTAVLIIGILASLLTFVNESWFEFLPEHEFSESKILGPIKEISDAVFPYLKNFFTNGELFVS